MKTAPVVFACLLFLSFPPYTSAQKTSKSAPTSKQPTQKTTAVPAQNASPVKTKSTANLHHEYALQNGINLEHFSMDLAPAIIFPIGSAASSTKLSPALQYRLWYHIKPNWAVGFETGIYELYRKRTDSKAGHVIPYLLNTKFSTKGKLFFELGAGMIRDEGRSGPSGFFPAGKSYVIKRFAYRAGIGLQLNTITGLHLRYEGAQSNSWVCLSAAFSFVNKENNHAQ